MRGPNPSWPPRLRILDASRGLAALAVVLWHWQHFSFAGYSLSRSFDASMQPFYPILKLFYMHGYAGVDYFFALSGFIFFWLYRTSIESGAITPRDFWIHRFSRLYPLHSATLILVALLQALYFHGNDTWFVYEFNDLRHFILNLFLATSWGLQSGHSFNEPVWSVSIEVLLYLAFFSLARSERGRPVWCAVISVLAFIWYQEVSQHPLLRGLSMFFLGGAAFHFATALKNTCALARSGLYVVCALSWTGLLVDVYIYKFSALLFSHGFFGKAVVIGAAYFIILPSTLCACAVIESRSKPIPTAVSWLGDISYSAYLIHFPLQLIIAVLASYKLVSMSFRESHVALIVFLGILLLISHLSYALYEKPMQIWLRTKLAKKLSR
jgi:peptidoglycan/LPS O-acetylase OafA/YrhL